MNGYNIVDNFKIEDHITFIRINPTNIELTLKEVFLSLSDLSWINEFDKDYERDWFQVRANETIKYISDNIIKSTDDSITSNSGEYVISELARKSLVEEFKYSNIPLGEIIKQQKSGNPGFDFFSENNGNIILFGEAKYLSDRNSYGNALKQIERFEREKRDVSDLKDIKEFCSEESLSNVTNKNKGYVAAFSSKVTSTEELVNGIKANRYFQILSKFQEIVCVAVNI